jgi:uncharacterized membrane-anchored protein YhcB (DUF1043 family)
MIETLAFLTLGLVIGYAIFYFTNRKPSATVVRVVELRREAQELEKKAKELKDESAQATIDFEFRLREHRARYGHGPRPPDQPRPKR